MGNVVFKKLYPNYYTSTVSTRVSNSLLVGAILGQVAIFSALALFTILTDIEPANCWRDMRPYWAQDCGQRPFFAHTERPSDVFIS
jgi:hypothetical protein